MKSFSRFLGNLKHSVLIHYSELMRSVNKLPEDFIKFNAIRYIYIESKVADNNHLINFINQIQLI